MDKKKIWLVIPMALVLLFLVVGATYAYYTVSNTNNTTKSKFEVVGTPVGAVTFSSKVSDLRMKITPTDMAMGNIGNKYYAVTPDVEEDRGSLFRKVPQNHEIVRGVVKGTKTNERYICEGTIKIEASNTMYSVLQPGDMKLLLTANKAMIDNKKSITLDISDIKDGIQRYPVKFDMNKDTDTIITADMVMENREDDQRVLADTLLNINITLEGTPSCHIALSDETIDTRPKVYANLRGSNNRAGIFNNFYNYNSNYNNIIVKFVDYIDPSIKYENNNFTYDTNKISYVYDLTDTKYSEKNSVIAWIQGKTLYIGADNKRIFTKDMYYAFYNINFATPISMDDIGNYSSFTNLFTDEVTNMSYMFYYSQINGSNLSALNTKNVENMSGMFYYATMNGVSGVETFDVSNVKNMSSMFNNAKGSSINLNSWHVENVQDITSLFSNSYFGSINLSNWNLSGVKNVIHSVFNSATVTQIIMENWKLPEVDINSMFYHMKQIQYIDIRNMDASKVNNMDYMFDSLQLNTIDVYGVKTGKNINYMFNYTKLSNLNGLESMNVSNTESFKGLFSNFESTNTRIINLSNWDMSNAKYASGMFNYSSFQELNLSGWNLLNLTSINELSMFSFPKAFKLNLSNWKLPAVDTLYNFLSNTPNLMNLDISYWDASRVKSLRTMCINAQKLQIVIMTGINTEGVTDMSQLFQNCYDLQRIVGIEDLDLDNVTTIQDMFYNCKNLSSLDLHTWNVSNLKNMRGLFQNDTSLQYVNMNNWDTSKVENMGQLFDGANILARVEFANWDLASIDSTSNALNGLFNNCYTLNYVDFSTWKNIQNFYTNEYMFRVYNLPSDKSLSRTINISSFDYETVERLESKLFNNYDNKKNYSLTILVKDNNIKQLLESKNYNYEKFNVYVI